MGRIQRQQGAAHVPRVQHGRPSLARRPQRAACALVADVAVPDDRGSRTSVVRHRRYDATAHNDRSRRHHPRLEHLAFGERDRVGEKARARNRRRRWRRCLRARIDGSQRTRLTQGGRSGHAVWGKQRIAFSRVRASGDMRYPVYELWTMRPSGMGLRRVTRTSHAPVEWSADGRRLLTSTYSKSGSVLSVIDMETRAIRPLIRGQFVLPLRSRRTGARYSRGR